MHNHNKDGGYKSMIWMMLPCLLLVIAGFVGGNKFTSSKYIWLLIFGACIIPHLWIMSKGHEKNDEKQDDPDSQEDKHSESCH